jgi:hypothetical protein
MSYPGLSTPSPVRTFLVLAVVVFWLTFFDIYLPLSIQFPELRIGTDGWWCSLRGQQTCFRRTLGLLQCYFIHTTPDSKFCTERATLHLNHFQIKCAKRHRTTVGSTNTVQIAMVQASSQVMSYLLLSRLRYQTFHILRPPTLCFMKLRIQFLNICTKFLTVLVVGKSTVSVVVFL